MSEKESIRKKGEKRVECAGTQTAIPPDEIMVSRLGIESQARSDRVCLEIYCVATHILRPRRC